MSDEVVVEFEQSSSIGKLADALSKAQGEFKPAVKSGTNPHFRSSYADLNDYIVAAKAPLGKYGLSVVQLPFGTGENLGLCTMLMHSSGEWVRGSYRTKLKDANPQTLGSAISYLRRYSYGAVLGLSADDDDGESTAQRSPSKSEQQYQSEETDEIYRDADPKWRQRLSTALVNNKIESKYWQEIRAEMEGKPTSALEEIIQFIKKRPAGYEVGEKLDDPRQPPSGMF